MSELGFQRVFSKNEIRSRIYRADRLASGPGSVTVLYTSCCACRSSCCRALMYSSWYRVYWSGAGDGRLMKAAQAHRRTAHRGGLPSILGDRGRPALQPYQTGPSVGFGSGVLGQTSGRHVEHRILQSRPWLLRAHVRRPRGAAGSRQRREARAQARRVTATPPAPAS